MKTLSLYFFLAFSTFMHINLAHAQSSATPLTAIIMQDEAKLKQGLEKNDFTFYLDGINEEQFAALKKNAVYYEKHFAVEIISKNSSKEDKTECKITFLSNDIMNKRVLSRYFIANTISTVLFNGTSQSADDFFTKYLYLQ